jgi:hypothetical protein
MRVSENVVELGNYGGGNFGDIHGVEGFLFGYDFGRSIQESW